MIDSTRLQHIQRGDILYVDFGDQPGSVIHGIRPALVLQNNTGNRHSPTVIVAAITTCIKKVYQPTHIFLGKQFGLKENSMLLLEQIATVDKRQIINYVGTVSPQFMHTVNEAYAISIGLTNI